MVTQNGGTYIFEHLARHSRETEHGASWTGMNRVENIDIRFNFTSRNYSLTHRCRVDVTHQPDEMPGYLPPVISYDIIHRMQGHKIRAVGLLNRETVLLLYDCCYYL